MKFLPLFFTLFVILTFSSFAQSQEHKGCGKEKECVKSCEEHETEAEVHIKQDDKNNQTTVVSKNNKKQTTEGTTNKKTVVKKEVKKK